MFSAPTTTSPALPAMPERNDDLAPPVLAAGALACGFWVEEINPDWVENATF